MTRVKTGVIRRRKHKKIIKATKGYYGTRSKLFKRAHEAFLRAGEHSFAGRKLRKRWFRKLWIIRINAALKPFNMKYSKFINKLNKKNINLNRKTLANLAQDESSFKELVKKVQ